jgi:hypothetical protein
VVGAATVVRREPINPEPIREVAESYARMFDQRTHLDRIPAAADWPGLATPSHRSSIVVCRGRPNAVDLSPAARGPTAAGGRVVGNVTASERCDGPCERPACGHCLANRTRV